MHRLWWIPALLLLHGCGSKQPVVVPPKPADDYFDPERSKEIQQETAPPSVILYEDHIYVPGVRTVQVWRNGVEGDVPIIELGSADQLQFHFDDLSGATSSLSYTILHCDAQWKPDDLVAINYLDGAPSDFVPPPRSSSGTRQPYQHYAIPFPNSFMRPKISGNFLLLVHQGSDPNDPVITRRFLVAEQRVTIDARVVASREVEQRDVLQQLDLVIRHPGVPIPDPFGDLSVTVLQNQRWDDVRTGLQPRFTRANELVYDFPKQTLFKGGNEWRPLNARSIRYAAPGIKAINGDSALNKIVLEPDVRRNIKVYVDQPDLNGRHLVRTDDGYDPMIEADYVLVDLTLPFPARLSDGEVYVYGAFSNYQLTPEFRCTWDPAISAYRAQVMLKQGFADYAYAFVPDGSTVPDLGALEGSHFETENDYLLLVYLKDWTQRADRLIAARAINSRR